MKSRRLVRLSIALVAVLLVSTGARPPLRGCLDRATPEEAAGAKAIHAEQATVTCPTCAGRAGPRDSGTYVTCPACHGTGRFESGVTQTTCGTCNGSGVVAATDRHEGLVPPTCPTCRGAGRTATSTVKFANRVFYGPDAGPQLLRDEPGVAAFLTRRPDGGWTVVAAGATGNDGVLKWLKTDPRLARMRTRLGATPLAIAVTYERSAKRQRALEAAVLEEGGCKAPNDLE
jgi:hypothetical protein